MTVPTHTTAQLCAKHTAMDTEFRRLAINDPAADVLADEILDELPAGSAYRNVLAYWERSSGELLQRLLYTDIKTYLVELLMKQDNMSMAASIESRVPFLDHLLVCLLYTSPSPRDRQKSRMPSSA